jgi:hypothetical protein
MDPPYRGLLLAALRATGRVSAAAGVGYAILLALLTVGIQALFAEGQIEWPVTLLAALTLLVVGALVFHLVRIGIGRWRFRPSCIWNEGIWWLMITCRKPGVVGVRITVTDDLGGATSHSFAQPGPVIEDMFPDEFDVSGMKAGRKQPWGRYEVRWEVDLGGRRGQTTKDFYWGPVGSTPTVQG